MVELLGVVLGAVGNRSFVTITSSPADVRAAFAKPVTTPAWAGAYLEVLSFGLFLAFAIWACGRLGGGLLGAVAAWFATGYATLSIALLGLGDTLSYRAGHGMGLQLATTLSTLNEALYSSGPASRSAVPARLNPSPSARVALSGARPAARGDAGCES